MPPEPKGGGVQKSRSVLASLRNLGNLGVRAYNFYNLASQVPGALRQVGEDIPAAYREVFNPADTPPYIPSTPADVETGHSYHHALEALVSDSKPIDQSSTPLLSDQPHWPSLSSLTRVWEEQDRQATTPNPHYGSYIPLLSHEPHSDAPDSYTGASSDGASGAASDTTSADTASDASGMTTALVTTLATAGAKWMWDKATTPSTPAPAPVAAQPTTVNNHFHITAGNTESKVTGNTYTPSIPSTPIPSALPGHVHPGYPSPGYTLPYHAPLPGLHPSPYPPPSPYLQLNPDALMMNHMIQQQLAQEEYLRQKQPKQSARRQLLLHAAKTKEYEESTPSASNGPIVEEIPDYEERKEFERDEDTETVAASSDSESHEHEEEEEEDDDPGTLEWLRKQSDTLDKDADALKNTILSPKFKQFTKTIDFAKVYCLIRQGGLRGEEVSLFKPWVNGRDLKSTRTSQMFLREVFQGSNQHTYARAVQLQQEVVSQLKLVAHGDTKIKNYRDHHQAHQPPKSSTRAVETIHTALPPSTLPQRTGPVLRNAQPPSVTAVASIGTAAAGSGGASSASQPTYPSLHAAAPSAHTVASGAATRLATISTASSDSSLFADTPPEPATPVSRPYTPALEPTDDAVDEVVSHPSPLATKPSAPSPSVQTSSLAPAVPRKGPIIRLFRVAHSQPPCRQELLVKKLCSEHGVTLQDVSDRYVEGDGVVLTIYFFYIKPDMRTSHLDSDLLAVFNTNRHVFNNPKCPSPVAVYFVIPPYVCDIDNGVVCNNMKKDLKALQKPMEALAKDGRTLVYTCCDKHMQLDTDIERTLRSACGFQSSLTSEKRLIIQTVSHQNGLQPDVIEERLQQFCQLNDIKVRTLQAATATLRPPVAPHVRATVHFYYIKDPTTLKDRDTREALRAAIKRTHKQAFPLLDGKCDSPLIVVLISESAFPRQSLSSCMSTLEQNKELTSQKINILAHCFRHPGSNVQLLCTKVAKDYCGLHTVQELPPPHPLAPPAADTRMPITHVFCPYVHPLTLRLLFQ